MGGTISIVLLTAPSFLSKAASILLLKRATENSLLVSLICQLRPDAVFLSRAASGSGNPPLALTTFCWAQRSPRS